MMSKLPSVSSLSVANALEPSTIVKKTKKAAAKNVCKTVKSVVDLSTEELGFFIVNGKLIRTIFPR